MGSFSFIERDDLLMMVFTVFQEKGESRFNPSHPLAAHLAVIIAGNQVESSGTAAISTNTSITTPRKGAIA